VIFSCVISRIIFVKNPIKEETSTLATSSSQ
jgi:hypothetical protein